MNQMLEQFRAFFEGLEPRQRIGLGAGFATILLLMIGVMVWVSGENYETVYYSDNPFEVQEAAAALEEASIPHRVTEDGRRLETTTEFLGRARIASASSTGQVVGLENLDNVKLGTTPQRERWAYQRALQGELMRTINELDEVEGTRVHLVLPDRSAFLLEDRPASVSVTVRLRPGTSLGPSQVRGITSLVAAAVDGLSPDDVVLVDERGRLLAGRQEEDDLMAGGSTLMEARQAQEIRYRQNISDTLVPILGSVDHFSAAVSVELDPTSVETTIQTVDPDTQALLSEETRDEASTSNRSSGVPGTESNLPSSESPDEKGEERSSSEMVTNYDYSRTQERKIQGAGGLARISVSVVINKDRLDEIIGQAADASEVEADDPAALTDAPDLETLKKQIQDSVQVAVGYDQVRGDQVQVEFIAFSDVPEFSPLADEESSEGPNWLLWAVVGVLLALVIFVIRPAVQRRAAERGGRVPLLAPDGSVIEPEDDEEAVGAELARRLRGLVDQFETVSADDLNKLVEFQEEASAQVLRRWIRSE